MTVDRTAWAFHLIFMKLDHLLRLILNICHHLMVSVLVAGGDGNRGGGAGKFGRGSKRFEAPKTEGLKFFMW